MILASDWIWSPQCKVNIGGHARLKLDRSFMHMLPNQFLSHERYPLQSQVEHEVKRKCIF